MKAAQRIFFIQVVVSRSFGFFSPPPLGMFSDVAKLLSSNTKDEFNEEIIQLCSLDRDQRVQAMSCLVLLRDQASQAIEALAANTWILQGWLFKKKIKRSSLISGTAKRRYCVLQPDGLVSCKKRRGL